MFSLRSYKYTKFLPVYVLRTDRYVFVYDMNANNTIYFCMS